MNEPDAGAYVETVRVVPGARAKRAANFGRLLGTVAVDPLVLNELKVDRLASGTVQAHDALGQELSTVAKIDGLGRFLLFPIEASRGQIFVTATYSVPGAVVRLSALTLAPRRREDYPLILDAGTTFVADKMRTADLLSEGAVESLTQQQIAGLEDLTNAYLGPAQRVRIVQETDHNFNAFDFDHFMDAHPVLKRAVYDVNSTLLRGWKPENEAEPVATTAVRPVN
ncbi:MAG: hypothetical protein VKN33_04990 [Candidatus Sericytochromatia bacterium]|nr:hypothetical protein [Candidatus Sericytochromatia bacterium]